MKIELTKEQYEQLKDVDGALDIVLTDGHVLYFEFYDDMGFRYAEVIQTKIPGRKSFGFDDEMIKKTRPERVRERSYYSHGDLVCPTCGASAEFKFDYCPKCGQKLDYSEG